MSACGRWVLGRARVDLERFYPTIDGKPTVAYLWARTIKCKNCRAKIPLLKTKWLCKKDNERMLLKVEPNTDRTGPLFSILTGKDAATQGGNGAQRREYDKKIGAGTMSRAGARCVCCGLPSMKMEDIRLEGKAGRLEIVMTAVVVDGSAGKEYRLPTGDEIYLVADAKEEIDRVFAKIPFGIPDDAIMEDAKRNTRCVPYGVDQFYRLFTPRQLLALGRFVKQTRAVRDLLHSGIEREAISGYLAMMLDSLANQCGMVARWNQDAEKIEGTFARFALPIVWDFAEVNPLGETSGGYPSALEWVTLATSHFLTATDNARGAGTDAP